MGMRSSFTEQDIKVKDEAGLFKATKKLDSIGLLDFNEEEVVNFEGWDEMKLEGYWYDETVNILNTIAPYIEGWARFHYEEGYDFKIVFKNGRVYVQSQKEPEFEEPIPLEDLK